MTGLGALRGMTLPRVADGAGHHRHSDVGGKLGTAVVVQRWQTWRGGQQVLEDFKEAQARAERGGGFVFSGGTLVTARSFLVFEPETRRYGLYDWHDADGDGQPEAGESTRIWIRELPPAVHFGWAVGINYKACSNVAGTPSAAITFGTAAYPPCNGRPCLKFDQQGSAPWGRERSIWWTARNRSR